MMDISVNNNDLSKNLEDIPLNQENVVSTKQHAKLSFAKRLFQKSVEITDQDVTVSIKSPPAETESGSRHKVPSKNSQACENAQVYKNESSEQQPQRDNTTCASSQYPPTRPCRSYSTDSNSGITDMLGINDSRSRSVVEELLFEIYDHYGHRYSLDSDTYTECSSTSDAFGGRSDRVHILEEQSEGARLNKAYLKTKDTRELRLLHHELQKHVSILSARLLRQLKRRDRRLAKESNNCDVITAILQASSQKRRVDSQLRFTIKPQAGDDGFVQWRDAMRAVARLPMGIPHEFRKKVWLALADKHLDDLHIDWEKTRRFAFNEKSNPDDNKLGLQIVKDLHRTGCSGFSGADNDEERALLKRVLLAYARWNKEVGYCQGFNILAALILDVVDRREDDALKVMIYLIDHVLPTSYFAHNLRALSVDMAVFRDLLKLKLPQLASHLDRLQAAARDDTTGANYEPPLTNVFTMQWFLTLFATCLPKETALRIWDSVLLEGSEIMLRTALAIWSKLESRVLAVDDADEFYTTMGVLTQEMLDSSILNADSLIKWIYTMAPLPLPQVQELREKYTYNITPFSAAMATGGQRTRRGVTSVFSDDDDVMEDEDAILDGIGCFTAMFPPSGSRSPGRLSDADRSPSSFDVSKISPGAYGATPQNMTLTSAHAERMNLDLSSLKKQYTKVRARQKQAHIILAAANARHQANLHQRGKAPMSVKAVPATVMAPIESPVAVNHLYLGRTMTVQQRSQRKNKTVIEAPKIASVYGSCGNLSLNMTQRGSKNKAKSRNRNSNSSSSDSSDSSQRGVGCNTAGAINMQNRTNSLQSVTSDVSMPASSTGTEMSESISDVSTICGDDCDDVFHGRDDLELCDKVINEETGELVTNGAYDCQSKCDKTDSVRKVQSSPAIYIDNYSEVSHDNCDTSLNDSGIGTKEASPEPDTDGYKAIRPTSLTLNSPQNLGQQTERKVTHHHVFPEEVSDNEGTSASPSKPRVFNPFPSQHINRRRAQNGVKLGLYAADNLPKLELGMSRNRPLQSIGRQQISQCLHRQYMVEVKKHGSNSSK